jgi:hypothetical protein
MIREIVIDPLRMLFVNNIAFAALIYSTYIDLFSNERAVRYTGRFDIMLYVQRKGLIISILFAVVMVSAVMIISATARMVPDIDVLFVLSYLALFAFFYFQIFIILHLFTKKRLVPIIITAGVFLIVLGIYYALKYSYVVDDTWLPPVLDMRYMAIITTILIAINFYIIRKEDILCLE